MALKCSMTFNTYGGLAAAESYTRIPNIRTFKREQWEYPEGYDPETNPLDPVLVTAFVAEYTTQVFLDEAARQDGKNPLDTGLAAFEWDRDAQPDVYAACYAHLKSQDAYAAATDC